MSDTKNDNNVKPDINKILENKQVEGFFSGIVKHQSRFIYILIMLGMLMGVVYMNLFKLYPIVGDSHTFFWMNCIQQLLLLCYILFVYLSPKFYIVDADAEGSKKGDNIVNHLAFGTIILLLSSAKIWVYTDTVQGPLSIVEAINLFFLLVMLNFTKLFETDVGFSMVCPKYSEDKESEYSKYKSFLEDADNGSVEKHLENFMSKRRIQTTIGKFMTTIVFLFIMTYHQISIFKIKDYF